MKAFFIIISFFALLNRAWGQTLTEDDSKSLQQKITAYGLINSENLLFVHFDKNVYTNNENVWFTAYLLKKATARFSPKTLAVFLLNTQNKKIAYQAKFLMEDGISFGHLYLADTLQPGKYKFIAYVPPLVNNKVSGIFEQPILIRSSSQNDLKVDVSLDSIKSSKENYAIRVAIRNTNQGSINYSGKYFLGDNRSQDFKGNFSIKGGFETLEIPKNIIQKDNNTLYLVISAGKNSIYRTITLPFSQNHLNVNFFPEGGYLTCGLTSAVALEVRGINGSPLSTSFILFKNTTPVDTIRTNEFGIAKFYLKPQNGFSYLLRPVDSTDYDDRFRLPDPQLHGMVIGTAHAIATDTLTIAGTSSTNEIYYFVMHDFKQTYYITPIFLKSGIKRVLKFDLKDVPVGLTEITVLDNQKRPCAERMFFAHIDRIQKLSIQPDKQIYKKRQPVKLQLSLFGPKVDSINALVSVSCVQRNRVLSSLKENIINYTYLSSEFGGLPHYANWLGDKNQIGDLEMLLMVKGWRRYRWLSLEKMSIGDTAKSFKDISFKGNVLYDDKAIKKAVQIGIMGGSNLNLISTNNSGEFEIDESQMLTEEEKKVYLIIIGKDQSNFNIRLKDPFTAVNDSLAAISNSYETGGISNAEDFQSIHGLDHTIQLKEVTIHARSTNFIYPTNANACGDYVCINNILNCPNHRNDSGNRKPISGQTYFLSSMTGGEKKAITYQGCDVGQYSRATSVNGIYYAKDFYPEDYTTVQSSDPAYLSTIYWNHLIKLNQGSPITLTFSTSDISGAFDIIIQGISTKGVVYGETSINVE
jgi:hypothetical protein